MANIQQRLMRSSLATLSKDCEVLLSVCKFKMDHAFSFESALRMAENPTRNRRKKFFTACIMNWWAMYWKLDRKSQPRLTPDAIEVQRKWGYDQPRFL